MSNAYESQIAIFIEGYRRPHTSFKFSGGEIQVRVTGRSVDGPLNPRPKEGFIRANIVSADVLMEVLMAADAVRRMHPGISLGLKCPYFPYARQDRVCYPGEALAVKVFASIINAQGFEYVQVWDAHSDVTLALLDRVQHIPVERLAGNLVHRYEEMAAESPRVKVPVLVCPDEGAVKRMKMLAERYTTIYAKKDRDPKDGKIIGTEVRCNDLGSVPLLIVDDILDGGRTFIALSQELRKITTGEIILYVTHGIFSAGFDVLKPHLDQIYVANPWPGLTLPSFVHDHWIGKEKL
jgi:ribose-phosphate pyrophosphokinase